MSRGLLDRTKMTGVKVEPKNVQNFRSQSRLGSEYWLPRRISPITHRALPSTGRTFFAFEENGVRYTTMYLDCAPNACAAVGVIFSCRRHKLDER